MTVVMGATATVGTSSELRASQFETAPTIHGTFLQYRVDGFTRYLQS